MPTVLGQHTKSALGFEDMVVQQVITIALWTSTVTEGAFYTTTPADKSRSTPGVLPSVLRRAERCCYYDQIDQSYSSNSTAHWFRHDEIVVGCDRVATQNSYVCIKIGKLFEVTRRSVTRA